MRCCKKANYESIRIIIKCVDSKDVLTSSPWSVQTTDGEADARLDWVDDVGGEV